MSYPTVISFATDNYRNDSARLLRSLDRWNLSHYIEYIPDRGSWETNCAYKPTFILDYMEHHGSESVIWLDADAELVAEPDLFELPTGFDFAVHSRPDQQHRMRFASGTLFFSARALDLLREWERVQLQDSSTWDQQTLFEAYESMEKKPETCFLPKSYLTKFDEDTTNAVIVHHQASRRKR